MKCNWCGKGEGRNHTLSKDGLKYWYYCQKCLGNIDGEIKREKKLK